MLKNWGVIFFDKEKCASLWKLTTLFKTMIITKKNTSCIRIHSITVAKTICLIKHTRKNRSRKK